MNRYLRGLFVLVFASCSAESGISDSGFNRDGKVGQDRGVDATLDSVTFDIQSSDLLQPVPGTWVVIPPVKDVAKMPVTFKMGSDSGDPCHNKQTQHDVTLTRRFEIMDSEVTQGMFQTVMGYNKSLFGPNGSKGQTCAQNDCPVEMVSWYEAAAFCNKLSALRGLETCYEYVSGSQETVVYEVKNTYDGSGAKTIYDCPGYRLATEAEWEYAYRAGTTTAFYNGPNDGNTCVKCMDANADKIAWHNCNSKSKTHPAKGKTPNAWSLYDMAGNVWEWCHDWYQLDLGANGVTDPWGPQNAPWRVIRGGGWNDVALYLRAAYRIYRAQDYRNEYLGFRVARSSP
jgi:sulfatase modifying factor 1